MGLNLADKPSLSTSAVTRIQKNTQVLINTYGLLAERSLTADNERDLEGFAKILNQFSSLVAKITEREEIDLESNEIHMNYLDVEFRIDCFNIIYPN